MDEYRFFPTQLIPSEPGWRVWGRSKYPDLPEGPHPDNGTVFEMPVIAWALGHEVLAYFTSDGIVTDDDVSMVQAQVQPMVVDGDGSVASCHDIAFVLIEGLLAPGEIVDDLT